MAAYKTHKIQMLLQLLGNVIISQSIKIFDGLNVLKDTDVVLWRMSFNYGLFEGGFSLLD